MFRLILKNIWSRRGKHAWLFIELILVSIIAWKLIDHTTVLLYDASLPMGYDTDRLVKIDVGTLPESHKDYSTESADSAARMNSLWAFLAKVRALDGVAAATASGRYSFMGHPNINTGYRSLNLTDSIEKPISGQQFWIGTDFFNTIGITPASTSSLSVLSDAGLQPGDMIFTESYARRFSPSGNIPGGKVFRSYSGDTVMYNVVAVSKDVRRKPTDRSYDLAFIAAAPEAYDNFTCVARLKPGVDMYEFMRELRIKAPRELRAGNYMVKTVAPYSKVFENMMHQGGHTTEYTRGIALTVFFMLNILLGVVGSFYLQTRRRISEIGVHRAFGATQGNVLAMLIGEALVLGSCAFVVAELLYLQYAHAAGLSYGLICNTGTGVADTWVSSFGIHFALISVIVYVLLMACVLAGTYFPARKAAHINPIDALRNE